MSDGARSAAEPFLVTVNKASTTTTVTSSANPSVRGQPVTFTATVASTAPAAGAPTGIVLFWLDGGAPILAVLSGGRASYVAPSLSRGSHTFDAQYGGGGIFYGSSGSLAGGQTVDKANTTTTVMGTSANPSSAGQEVTAYFSVTVSPPGNGVPGGTVTAGDGTDSCTTALPATSCGIILSTGGTTTLTATYGGDANFNGSTSAGVTQTVGYPAPVLTSLEPGLKAAGSSSFILTVLGTGFALTSKVRWNGADRPTTFVNSTQLTATIQADDLGSTGTASVTVYTPSPGGGTSGPMVFMIGTLKYYFPFVLHNYVAAPDLVVQNITATIDSVQVVVKNQGGAAVTDDFWVDVYISPSPVPGRVNEIWDFLSSQGLVWGVAASTQPLMPGELITLSIGDAYYWSSISSFAGWIPEGTPVYAQVDSADSNTDYGAVRESHEIAGGAYNNIASTVSTP